MPLQGEEDVHSDRRSKAATGGPCEEIHAPGPIGSPSVVGGRLMFRVSESAIIERPPAEVFGVAADPQEQLKWDHETLRNVEKLTPGPLGLGARYRGEFKGFGTVEYEYDVFEPGHKFTHRAEMKIADVRHTFEFEEVPEGTRLTQSIVAEPKGMGRLMAPIMKVMMRRRLRVIDSEVGQYLLETPRTPSAQQ